MKRTLSKRFLGKKSLWAKLIVHPRHTFRWLWDIVLGMYIILDLWLVPYFIAFHYGQKLDHVKIYLYIQDTFYICDVLISFFTAYVERKGYEKHLENRPHLVALRYIKSYLIFDIIAYFGSLPFSGCYTIWCILKFLRIYKFVGLLKIHGLNNVSIDLINGLKIMTMIITLVYFAHFGACTVYYVGKISIEIGNEANNWILTEGLELESVGKQYTSSIYWSMMTVTTVGYGDVNMINDWERMCAVVLMIFFNLLGAIIFGNITNIIASLGQGSERLRHRTKQLQEFINAYEVPLELQQRLHDTLMYQWEYNRCEDMTAILNSYPQFLKRDCLMHIHLAFIRKVPFFSKVPDGFIRAIITRLQFELCLAKDVIIHEGDAAKEMYFLRSGKVDIYAPQSSRVVVTLQNGAFFGEIGLLMEHGRRMNNVIAAGQCEIFILTKEALDYALGKFPECKQSLNEAAVERLNMVRKQKVKSRWKNSFKKIKAINKSSRSLGIPLRDQSKEEWEQERVLVQVLGFEGKLSNESELQAIRPGLKNIASSYYLKVDLDGNDVQLSRSFAAQSDISSETKDVFEFKHLRKKRATNDELPSINISLNVSIIIEGWTGGSQVIEISSLTIPLSLLKTNVEHDETYDMVLNTDILKHRQAITENNDVTGIKICLQMRRLVLRRRLGSVNANMGISGNLTQEGEILQQKLSKLAEQNKLNAEDLSSSSESESEPEEFNGNAAQGEKQKDLENEDDEKIDPRRPSLSALSNISVSSQQNHEEIKREVTNLKEELALQREMLLDISRSFRQLMEKQNK